MGDIERDGSVLMLIMGDGLVRLWRIFNEIHFNATPRVTVLYQDFCLASD